MDHCQTVVNSDSAVRDTTFKKQFLLDFKLVFTPKLIALDTLCLVMHLYPFWDISVMFMFLLSSCFALFGLVPCSY